MESKTTFGARCVRCWDMVKGLLLLCALIGSGFAIGYQYATVQILAMCNAETARIRADYARALDVIAGKQARAADALTSNAEAVENAAAAVQEAAEATKAGPPPPRRPAPPARPATPPPRIAPPPPVPPAPAIKQPPPRPWESPLHKG